MSKLIVLEGLDGSGKGTQTELLQAYLNNAGYRTHVIDFPNYRSEGSALVKLYPNGGLGKTPDDIRYLYEECRNWLLDYDIERMKTIFEQK